ncbi:MAG: FUN14 domain-containing protein [Gammaproteobacteria bacterium]
MVIDPGAAAHPPGTAPSGTGGGPGSGGSSLQTSLLPDQPGGGTTSGETASEPTARGVFRLGFSFIAGFCLGSFIRATLRIAAIAVGFWLAMTLILAYYGLVDVNWHSIDELWNHFVANVEAEWSNFQTFITGSLPAAGGDEPTTPKQRCLEPGQDESARRVPNGRAAKLPRRQSTLDFDQYQALRRFPALDGVRAIAILLVFTAHPAYQHFWPALHGPNGVSIFFVLSGFLITTLALREEARNGVLDLRAFFIRRVCRIYPLYAAVLLLYCVLMLGAGFEASRKTRFIEELPYYSLGLPEHGLFLRQVVAPFDGAWSLGIEEKFYVLWPLLLVATTAAAVGRRFTLLVLIGVASVVAPFISPYGIFLAPYIHIVLGCMVALLLQRRTTYHLLRRLGAYPVLPLLAVGFLLMQFCVPHTGLGKDLYAPYGVTVCLLLVGLITTTSPSVRWLWSRPMVVTATLSYALYLTHNFGLNAAEKIVPGGYGLAGSCASTAIGLTAAYVFAYALNRTVERPFITFGRRIAGSLRTHHPRIPERAATLLP